MPTRHTNQRQDVLRAVKLSAVPITAVDISGRLGRSGTSRATIFRNLRSLVEHGEIIAVDGDDGTRRYSGSSFHHATFTCQRCKKERRLPSRTLRTYVNRKMWGRQLVFSTQLKAQGICGECRRILRLKGSST